MTMPKDNDDGLPTKDDAAFVDKLKPIREWLAAPRADIERIFLEMGDNLIGCAQLLNDISSAHEGMPAELGGEAFRQVSLRLEAICDQVREMGDSHSGGKTPISQLHAMAAAVALPLRDLSRAAATIEIITTNARIVAADLGGQQGEFAVFTSDMGELGRLVDRVVGEFTRSYERLMASLGVAEQANSAFAARHGETLRRIAGQMGAHLESVEMHRERGAAKAAEHSHLTGQIAMRVGTAVSALQIGDITRQRIEHVEEALDALVEHGEIDGGSASGEKTVAVVCRLQTVQLAETIDDFDRQVTELAETLRRLAEDATVALSDNGQESEALLATSGSALAAMTEELGLIGTLFEDFEHTRTGLESAAGQAAHAMGDMVQRLDAIRDVQQRIRLLSLNTAIRCSQLGERGSALKVVAGFLGELAGQTVSSSGAILDGLEEADELARGLVQEYSAGADGKVAVLEREIAAVQLELAGVVTRLRERAETVACAGPKAVRLLEEAAANVAGHQGFSGAWSNAGIELEAHAHPLGEPFEMADVDADLIARLRSRYTMDSERRLHDQLFGASTEEAEVATPEEADDLEDIFF